MIFGLYGLALYVAIALIGLAVSALFMLIAIAVGLVTHPLRTLALLLSKVAGLAAGLALILTAFFWYASKVDGGKGLPVAVKEREYFYLSVAVLVVGVIVYGRCEWFLERPTRAERRAMREYEAQSMSYAPRPIDPR